MKGPKASAKKLKRNTFFFGNPPGHEISNLKANALWTSEFNEECNGYASAYANGIYFTRILKSEISSKHSDVFIGWDYIRLRIVDSTNNKFTIVAQVPRQGEKYFQIYAGTRHQEYNEGTFQQWLYLFTVVERL